MHTMVRNMLRLLFVLALTACLLLGAALTLAQFLGAVLQSPDLIVKSEQMLLQPAIASAAAFGLLAFLASYFESADSAPGAVEEGDPDEL